MRRAEGLVAKSAGLGFADALGEVFRDDPGLSMKYAKADSTPAPTFADQLLGYELEGVYPLVNALMSTLRGIADSSAADKGVRIAGALNEFTAAVLRAAGQVGIAVPTEKRASDFIPASTQAAIIKTAGELSPGDYVKGMRGVEVALQEIRGWAAERGAAYNPRQNFRESGPFSVTTEGYRLHHKSPRHSAPASPFPSAMVLQCVLATKPSHAAMCYIRKFSPRICTVSLANCGEKKRGAALG
jgi:hypothetical protein